jgi:hypothetical protein
MGFQNHIIIGGIAQQRQLAIAKPCRIEISFE